MLPNASFAYARDSNAHVSIAQHVADKHKHRFVCILTLLLFARHCLRALFLYKPELGQADLEGPSGGPECLLILITSNIIALSRSKLSTMA
jgi:hypothetical protein